MTFDVAGVKKTAELKTGDKIMVSYTEKDGNMVAKDILVQQVMDRVPKRQQ
jgi:Cu/Ag efflux protein CusF